MKHGKSTWCRSSRGAKRWGYAAHWVLKLRNSGSKLSNSGPKLSIFGSHETKTIGQRQENANWVLKKKKQYNTGNQIISYLSMHSRRQTIMCSIHPEHQRMLKDDRRGRLGMEGVMTASLAEVDDQSMTCSRTGKRLTTCCGTTCSGIGQMTWWCAVTTDGGHHDVSKHYTRPALNGWGCIAALDKWRDVAT